MCSTDRGIAYYYTTTALLTWDSPHASPELGFFMYSTSYKSS